MADPVTIGFELFLVAAQMALTASQKFKGPRLKDRSVSLADYGTPIPRLWGKRRLTPQIIWAKPLHEKKVTNKTKGGKYTEYKYDGSWAWLLTDEEIDDVSRIWFDKRLVYDRTGAGPISLAALLGDKSQIKLTAGHNMRIYLGTEDQLPDPMIEAWCEDRYGPNTCPAYRGSAMIVYEKIPLEQAGNRIPQGDVEVINNKSTIHPYEQESSTTSIGGGGFAFSGGWMIRWDTDGFMDWFDLPLRQELGASFPESANGAGAGTVTNVALAADGTAYYYGTTLFDGFNHLYTTTPLGVTDMGTAIGNATHRDPGPCRVFDFSDGTRQVYGGGFPFNGTGGYYLGEALVTDSSASRDFCLDDDDGVWALFQPLGSSNQFEIRNLVGAGETFTITGSATRGGPNAAYFCYVAQERHFFVLSDGYWYLIDRDLGTIKDSGTQSYTTRGEWNSGRLQQQPGTQLSFWSSMTEISLVDGSTIRSLNSSDWLVESLGDPALDPTNFAIVSRSTSGGTHVTWRYLDRVTSNGVTLATVVDDVSAWSGLTGQDTSDLTQTVLGYSVVQGTGKEMIEPLLAIHDVDARPHDFSVQFVNRGDAASGTILTESFVRNGNTRYKVTRQQDTDLPREVTVNFADNDHDQQPNNVKSPRPVAATDSNRTDTIDLSTYADTANSAQQKVDRYVRRLWNSRERTNLSLTARYLALEPGDVTAISLDGALRNVRLDKMTITPTQIDCEFVRDEVSFAALNSATGGPSMDGRDDETIFIPAATRGFVMDIPLIQDADNDVNPIIYVEAGGYSDPWPGAFIYRGDDGTYDEQFAAEESSAEATWGLTTEVLGDASPYVWDRGNTVNVKFFNGTPATVTEADIDDDPTLNLAAIGSQANGYELVQFTTPTLQGDGSYDISGFKRGRRGTEGYIGTHVAGDEFILLDNAVAEQLGMDDVGDALSFKAASAGRSLEGSPAINVAFTGASLKPYAPARIKWTTDGTDMFGEIIRRTRVGGSWTDSGSVPLSENSEEYEVDIYHGATFKRTITVTGTNTFTYTGAEITADGNTVGVVPTFNAYQISDAVGRGFALAA